MQKPSILIPYHGASSDTRAEDVFIFMRPDTNGALGEKAVLNAIHCCPEYSTKHMQIAYLANIPSDTIIYRRICEQYYMLKMHFATLGGVLFTPAMRRACSEYFHTEFDPQRFVGAFPALELFSWSMEEMFNLRVDAQDILTLNGQTIKRYKGYFIVNYDIPALIHRYSLQYDIAVICVRMIGASYTYFASLADKMRKGLISEGVITPDSLFGRGFHYSRGPFDQLRDGAYFLVDEHGAPIPLEQLSFSRYLMERDVPLHTLQHLVENPVVTIADDDGGEQEVSIVDHTREYTYADAYSALTRVQGYSMIDSRTLVSLRATSPTTPRMENTHATT